MTTTAFSFADPSLRQVIVDELMFDALESINKGDTEITADVNVYINMNDEQLLMELLQVGIEDRVFGFCFAENTAIGIKDALDCRLSFAKKLWYYFN